MQWIGYIGLIAITICWIPQSLESIRQGRCEMNLIFLILASVGGFSLFIYAVSLHDIIFSILNGFATIGASLNLFYKFFPRTLSPQ